MNTFLQASWWHKTLNLFNCNLDVHVFYFYPSVLPVIGAQHVLRSGGSTGEGLQGRPLGGPNSFIFMQFSAKKCKKLVSTPTLGVSALHSGKSWIRHCYGNVLISQIHSFSLDAVINWLKKEIHDCFSSLINSQNELVIGSW